jgi:hypothetical protein
LGFEKWTGKACSLTGSANVGAVAAIVRPKLPAGPGSGQSN